MGVCAAEWLLRLGRLAAPTSTLFFTVGYAALGGTGFELIVPAQSPTTEEWQRFHQSTMEERAALWRQAPALGAWTWQWRLAWVRIAAKELPILEARSILTQGSIDRAAVVRIATARELGMHHDRLGGDWVVATLENAFESKRNLEGRGGRVQAAILSSLWLIRSPRAADVGKRLAAGSSALTQHWNSLHHAVDKGA